MVVDLGMPLTGLRQQIESGILEDEIAPPHGTRQICTSLPMSIISEFIFPTAIVKKGKEPNNDEISP